MILYFSGTGNSEFCAKYLSKKIGDETLNLFNRLKNKDVSKIESQKPFVVVCPTYAWRIPQKLNELLLKTPLNKNKDIYFVMTCGGEIGNAGKYLKLISEEKNMNYKGVYPVKMPDNYIAMFNIEEDSENKKIIKKAIPQLDNISKIILGGQEFPLNKITVQDKALSGFINSAFYSLFVNDKAFYATDDCVACGKCKSFCPLGNIKMVNNKPSWNGDCTHCMACISHCPEKAIEYGKKSKGKLRYTFPKDYQI